jgi:hypothetical protein
MKNYITEEDRPLQFIMFSANFRRKPQSVTDVTDSAADKASSTASLLSFTISKKPRLEENLQKKEKKEKTPHLGQIDWDDAEINLHDTKEQEKTPLWEEVARPRTLEEVRGQDAAKNQLNEWLDAPITKPVLLAANSSCGKTSIARAILTSRGYSIWDETQIGVDDNLGDALEQLFTRSPLTGTSKRAVLLECAEGILGDEKTKLVKALKNVTIPVIITCDDIYDQSIKSIKDACKIIQLRPLDPANARAILIRTASRCGKPLSPESADTLLDASHGNVRQAINSMQFMVMTKHRTRTHGSEETALKESDKPWDLFASSARICSGVIDTGSEDIASSDLDLALTMLQHNVANSARSLHSASDALDALSLSDILMTRYLTDAAVTLGIQSVASACKGPQRCPRMQFPSLFGKMSSMRSREIHLRTAATPPASKPTTGPTLTFAADKNKDKGGCKVTPIAPNSSLQQFSPTAFDAHELILVHSAKIKKSDLKPKALKDAGLLTDSEPANAILKKGVWDQ